MSQYNSILAERHFPLVDRPYYHRNQWPSYYNESSPQLTVYHSEDNDTWQNSPQIDHFPQPTQPNPFPDYPESSQRTILTSSPPDEIESGLHHHSLYDHRRSHSSDYGRSTLWHANTPPSLEYPDLEMHVEDHPEEAATQSRQASPPVSLQPSVKVEPEDLDDCFIMELSSMSDPSAFGLSVNNQVLASPTEVPLRATQASKEMRKMMGVFRLNPFTMHTGEGRGVIMPAPWCGGGPLEEEPLIFEFQLDIEDRSGDRAFEYVLGISSGPCTNSDDVQLLRSFSPSFELHPEDLRSEVGGEEQELADHQQNEWEDVDYGEVDTSSSSTTTTHSVHTPSETRSQTVHTPFNESSVFHQYPTPPPAPVASTWDIDSHQPHGEEHLGENMEGGHKMHRLHTTTSHPYLRRSLLNHRVSPSSSTHSLSQSRSELYPVIERSTTHHQQQQQQQHYNGNQVVFSQGHNNSQSYSQLQTFHESMVVSSPLELIPVSASHRVEAPSGMRSGRTGLKPPPDEALHHHHHPGIASEYMPRGMDSSTYDTGQHEYETISSVGNHVFSRRWSLPETIGGPFRGASM